MERRTIKESKEVLLKLYTDTYNTARNTAKVLSKYLLPLVDAVERRNYTEAHKIVGQYRATTTSRKGMGTARVLSPQYKAMVIDAYTKAPRDQRSAVLVYYGVSLPQVKGWMAKDIGTPGVTMRSLPRQHKQSIIEPPWLTEILEDMKTTEPSEPSEDLPDFGEVHEQPNTEDAPSVTMSEVDLLMFDDEEE